MTCLGFYLRSIGIWSVIILICMRNVWERKRHYLMHLLLAWLSIEIMNGTIMIWWLFWIHVWTFHYIILGGWIQMEAHMKSFRTWFLRLNAVFNRLILFKDCLIFSTKWILFRLLKFFSCLYFCIFVCISFRINVGVWRKAILQAVV